jgi:glycosyltransferase involved in cell wall biosynthesis
MVYNCIERSPDYTLEYFSIDQIDISHFAATGRVRCLTDAPGVDCGDFDFWVFNWHFVTMAAHLDPAVIAGLHGAKFTIVLELAPGDPLKLVPPGVFDGYIALDPDAPTAGGIYPFCRPLPGEPLNPPPTGRSTPVIGSFGFGTPGKGFELLVEAANRAFETAIIRVNVPIGTYVFTEGLHRRNYVQHIESVCKRIAKPGIEVRFTRDFMSPDELVSWCGENDLNCFMYTRCQPGLSATTDQAIISGRPLLTSSNDTFRHIHRYIPPYPIFGLREAMETTTAAVQALQRDWSRGTFSATFHRMLADFGLIGRPVSEGQSSVRGDPAVKTILIIPRYSRPYLGIRDYSVRLRDALGRSPDFRLVLLENAEPVAVKAELLLEPPDVAILVDMPNPDEELRRLLEGVPLKISVSRDWSDDAVAADGTYQVRQTPIVPFYTFAVALSEAPAIWLVGFSAAHSRLEDVVLRILVERPGARIRIAIPDMWDTALEARVISLRQLHNATEAQISFETLPHAGDQVIELIGADSMAIFAYDPRYAEELEAYSALALATERPVFFTRYATFPDHGGTGYFIEDVSIDEAINFGVAAQIGVLHDFGEWQMAKRLGAAIKAGMDSPKPAPFASLPLPITVASLPPPIENEALTVSDDGGTQTIGLEQLLALHGRGFVDSAFREFAGRPPTPEELMLRLRQLSQGESKAAIAVEMYLSMGRGRPRPSGLDNLIRRHKMLDLPVVGPLLQKLGWQVAASEVDPSFGTLEHELLNIELAQAATEWRTVSEDKAPAISLSSSGRPGRSIRMLLIGTVETLSFGVGGLTTAFARAVYARDEALRMVVWDNAPKRLRMAKLSELRAAGLPEDSSRGLTYLGAEDESVLLEPGDGGEFGWLIVLDNLRLPEKLSLVEMDVMLEARRIGLRSAFAFHGADPLRLPNHAGAVSASYELFMQSLLLADLIISPSQDTGDDLRDFFIQHQLADFWPPVHVIRPPVSAALESEWSDYLRRMNGALTEASDRSRHLRRLYVLLDSKARTSRPSFEAHLVAGLTAMGVAVIPADWDEGLGRLAPIDFSQPSTSGQGILWSDWIEPGQADAPKWVLCPDNRLAAMEYLPDYARRCGLRVAAILRDSPTSVEHSGVSSSAPFSHFAALTQCDKVFATSEDQFEDFYLRLLASRRKFHSADHRLALVLSPPCWGVSGAGPVGRNKPRDKIEVRVRIPRTRPVDLGILAAALSDVSARSLGRIRFEFAGTAAHPPAIIAGLANGNWLTVGALAVQSRETRRPDFVIFAGLDGASRSEVEECLASGTPCLTHTSGTSHVRPGLDVTDFSDRAAITEAIFKMAEPGWLDCLAEEARSANTRTWMDYAGDLVLQMATDRLRDVVEIGMPPEPGKDIYVRLPNLRRRPKLSICISTYNRAGWIAWNLENLFSQIGAPGPDIEVLVVDNTSTDNTSDVANIYSNRPDFIYVRNPKNVGMLGNLAVTAQLARGEFVWILGDDDFARPPVIGNIRYILSEHPNTQLIYFNYGYTSLASADQVESLDALLNNFNVLEPDCPSEFATVSALAAKDENFYTAIYAFAARRDHAMRAYCQDTSGRIFSTMVSCIPSAYYILNYMPNSPAYWIGQASLVMNSNVSWADYGALLDLEHLPAAWDLAERMGTPAAEVDRRRANRLWLLEMMWRDIFQRDPHNNSAYFSAPRTLMRLKHLPEMDGYAPKLRAIYEEARARGHPAAQLETAKLFSAFA